jgi:holin-like protein
VIRLLLVLFVFQLLGELLVKGFLLPIPGAVAGLMLLLVYLFLRKSEAGRLATASQSLLSHLALFLVPAATGIVTQWDLIAGEWAILLTALLTSTVASILVTAFIMRKLVQ